MKAAFFALGALALASTAAAETPRHLQGWLDQTREQITQAAGPDVPGPGTVAIRFTVGSDDLRGPVVVRSSGSAAVDAAAVKAASKVRPKRAPTDLLGQDVVLRVSLGQPALVTAGSLPATR